MAGNQNLYNQDPQYNQAYAATDPGNYYDNSAFQEGVGDASYYDYNAAPYDAQGLWDVVAPAPPPSLGKFSVYASHTQVAC
ncbi:uncharacterized protein LOC142814489 isoform X3 [Rhipicephalus microplus]|uniref:uncharacterized protein LOC142814489 isoform X3 n=1 Tax=Rhipicephalus microplus TaxID=6941 RepID=UPI003F6CAADD